MTYTDVLNGLEGLSVRGMDFGVERTRALLDGLSSPDKKLKIIHIAGTNGKGSVAEYLTRILISAGKTVGTFTSPAVYNYLEQFRINGTNITEELFAKAFGDALQIAGSATRFEVETAGALNAFALAGCEYAVIECGLGGLYDATNAIYKKEAAVITSISLEHTAVLGDTIESICRHKSGIIKDCPAVVSALQFKETLAYMRGKGAIIADKPLEILLSGLFGRSFTYGGKRFVTQMTGYAQPYNAAAAIETARLLKIDENAIYAGVKSAKLSARIEIITLNGRQFILDGAHNPACFVQLAAFIKENFGSVGAVVFGSLSDKDAEKNLSYLKEFSNNFIAVKPHSLRAMATDKLIAVCAKLNIKATAAESVASALENAVKADGAVLVCGTFTILKEAKEWIEKKL